MGAGVARIGGSMLLQGICESKVALCCTPSDGERRLGGPAIPLVVRWFCAC